MFSINHLPHRARRAAISTLLASCTAVSLLSGMVPSASAQSAAPLSVSINDVAVTEGVDSFAVFTVTVSARHPNQGITVDYETRDVSAVAGMDYTTTKGTLPIAASDASNDGLTGTISVPIIDDATHEPTETFNVKLLSTTSVDIAKNGGVGTATITSDDLKPKLRIRDAQATEDAGSMVFNVDLDRPDSADVTVDWATSDDLNPDGTPAPNAANSQDYKPTFGNLTFPANTNVTQQIEVPIKDDKVFEGDEHFLVELSNNFNANIARGTATGTIVDDEVKPVLAMSTKGFGVPEDNVDWTENVVVNLSGMTDKDVTFSYSTSDGTAPAAKHEGKNKDYEAVTNGTGTIRAGTTQGFVPVTIHGDQIKESDEDFIVTISDQSPNARLGAPSTIVTLENDD
jgi:hypothetical protein